MKEYLIKRIKSNVKVYKKTIEIYDYVIRHKKQNVFLRFIYNILFLKKIRIFKNSSVYDYAVEKSLKINYLEDKQYREVYIPTNVPVRKEAQVLKCLTPSIYNVVLKDVMIIGASNIILKEKQCLNDKFLLPYSEEFELSTGPVHKYSVNESEIEIDLLPKSISEGISLIGEAANNYYHWVFDLLNRIAYINQFDELRNIPLLVDETVPRHTTCIRLLNVIDEFQHPIVYLKANRVYKVKTLYYFSPCTWTNVYGKKGKISEARYAKSSYALNYFRRYLSKLVYNKNCSVGKKIFITRPADKFKRLVNENELAEIAVKYGFELYDPARFSIEQQATDFSNVKYIIAASGAALVNLIWCRPGTKLLCVSLAEWNDYNYSTLAYLLNIECTYFDGQTIEGTKHKVDKVLFENYIRTWDLKEGISVKKSN